MLCLCVACVWLKRCCVGVLFVVCCVFCWCCVCCYVVIGMCCGCVVLCLDSFHCSVWFCCVAFFIGVLFRDMLSCFMLYPCFVLRPHVRA